MYYNVDLTNGDLRIRYGKNGGTKKDVAKDECPSIDLAGMKLVAWKLLVGATNSRKKADKFWKAFYDDKVKKHGSSQYWSINAFEIRSWVYYKESSEEDLLEVDESE